MLAHFQRVIVYILFVSFYKVCVDICSINSKWREKDFKRGQNVFELVFIFLTINIYINTYHELLIFYSNPTYIVWNIVYDHMILAFLPYYWYAFILIFIFNGRHDKDHKNNDSGCRNFINTYLTGQSGWWTRRRFFMCDSLNICKNTWGVSDAFLLAWLWESR